MNENPLWGLQSDLQKSEKPIYSEDYVERPLLYLSLAGYKKLHEEFAGSTEWANWVHKVHCTLDTVSQPYNLYKITAEEQGGRCVFTLNPAIPGPEQVSVMLTAGEELLEALNKVLTPAGAPLNPKVTIHGGDFTGAVVGSTTWAYRVYGRAVFEAEALDGYGEQNCMQLSGQARALMQKDAKAWHCKSQVVTVEGRAMQLWVRDVSSGDNGPGTSSSTTGVAVAPGVGGGSSVARSRAWCERLARRWTALLSFQDPLLEKHFHNYSNAQWMGLDLLAMATHLTTVLCVAFSIDGRLSSSYLWYLSMVHGVVLLLGIVLYLFKDKKYHHSRDLFCMAHHLINFCKICTVPRACTLLEASGSTLVYPYYSPALVALMDMLLFRMRFNLQSVANCIKLAVAILAVMCGGVDLEWGAKMMVALLAYGVVMPSAVLYLWEYVDRRTYLATTRVMAASKSGKSRKEKVV